MATSFTIVEQIFDAFTATLNVPTIQKESTVQKTTGITEFTRTQIAPAITVQETIGLTGQDRLNGIYVIDLFYPRDVGTASALVTVDLLLLAFEAGTVLTDGSDNVEIWNSYPTPSLPNLENFYQRQVIVEWRSYRNRLV